MKITTLAQNWNELEPVEIVQLLLTARRDRKREIFQVISYKRAITAYLKRVISMGNEVEKQPTKYKFVIQGVLNSSWTAFHKNEPDEKPVDFLNRSVMQDRNQQTHGSR